MINMNIWNADLMKRVFGERPLRIGIIGQEAAAITKADLKILKTCDVWMKFNNWATRKGLEILQKTGPRCDLWGGTLDCISREGNPRLAVQLLPTPHRINDGDRLLSRFFPCAVYGMTDPYWSRDFCRMVSSGDKHEGWKHPGLPTVGTMALMCLVTMVDIGELPAFIFVTGMTWYLEADGNLKGWNYLTSKRQPLQWNHPHGKEAVWAKRLLSKDYIMFGEKSREALSWLKEDATWAQM